MKTLQKSSTRQIANKHPILAIYLRSCNINMRNEKRDIDELADRIKKLDKSNNTDEKKTNDGIIAGARIGTRLVVDFLSAILIGAAMGYFLDETLNTKPFLFIFLLLAGAGAGFLNIYRFLKSLEEKKEK